MSGITADQKRASHFAEVPGVVGRLERARDEQKRYRVWLGLASLLLAALGIVALFMLIDWMWVVPAWVRALALPVITALAVFRYFRAHRPYSSRQAAADAEAHFPELGQRLRTVVQYADPNAKTVPVLPGLLRALGRETDRRTSALDFQKLIPWSIFERRAIGLCLACVVALVALFVSPSLGTAAQRMLFLPVHYTTMSVEPGDVTVKAGESLQLAVTLKGRPVSKAQWSYKKQNGNGWISASLPADPEPGATAKPLEGLLTATLEDCQDDFDYRVTAGEVESRSYHVRVVHPLLLKGLQATITPPPYTRKPPVVAKDGHWNAAEGSRVELEIQLDRSPRMAAIALKRSGDPSSEKIALEIKGTKLSGVIASVNKNLDLEITAADADGVTLEPEKRQIKVTADHEPTLRFIQPEESLAVIPTAEVPIQVDSHDDFGLSMLGITFKIGDGPEETLHLARFQDQPVTAQVLETLYLEKYSIDYTGAITYYAFAEDNYPPKPHRVVSELRFIDILPFKQDYQLAERNEGGSCNGSSVSLEELIARQRENLNRTFALERETSVDDAAAGRLAKYEGELHAATAEFARGIAQIAGPIPALEEAVTAMQSAATSLEAKDLSAARPLEEAALKGLISARQNLRKKLNQNSSSQASACRKFDRQQAQKLRRPPADQAKQQLAALEKDLRELARREQKFSEEIDPKVGGGPQIDPPEAQEQQPKGLPKPSTNGSKSSSSPRATASQNSKPTPGPAEQQKQAAIEAERLSKLAQDDEALTEHAKARLDRASGSVKDSSQAIDELRKAEAAQKAGEAARQLDSLARQVGALKAGEVSNRLARQRDFALEIARAERDLGQALERQTRSQPAADDFRSRLAGRQRELAEDTGALADVLKQEQTTAKFNDRDLAAAIDQAASDSPPREVEQLMRRNADSIGSGETELAGRDAATAAGLLEALAHDLESARRAAAGPELERLLAAEKEAANVQKRLRTLRQSSQQAGAERALEDLARRIQNLSQTDGRVKDAALGLVNATQSSHAGWTLNDRPTDAEPSYFMPPIVYTEKLGAVIVALQAKIQELILENTLAERNGPVPPEYRNFVDDYYRVLSQDLR